MTATFATDVIAMNAAGGLVSRRLERWHIGSVNGMATERRGVCSHVGISWPGMSDFDSGMAGGRCVHVGIARGPA